jgi:type I restriction enzyme S subunit
MPDKLPKGWEKTTLGEVNIPSRARALATGASDLLYVGMEHIEPQTMKMLGPGEASGVKSSSVRFSKGDVLYGKMRPYLNKVWLAEFDGQCSAEFLVFPKTEGLNSQLFAYRLNSQDFVSFANHQVSGERPRVDFEKLAKFTYLLAPTREQARRALERIQRYRAAVLHAAVTGELTRDWRKTHQPNETGAKLLKRLLTERRARWEEAELGRRQAAGKPSKDEKWKERYSVPRTSRLGEDGKLPRSWTWASIEEICMRVTVGHVGSMKTEYVRHGIPFLRSQNIRSNRFDPVGLLYIRRLFHEQLQKSKIFPGDVAVVRSGVNVGTTCVIPESLGEGNCSDLVLVQRPMINPHLLSYYMNSAARKHVAAGKVGVAIPHFNTRSVALLAIAVPPKDEQSEIVQEVERRLTAADRLTSTLHRQIERARISRQALLREAFVGNLVPQNPNDEPAAVLLERLRAAREGEAKKPKAKRMQKPKLKSVETLEQLEELINRLGKGATPERILLAAGLGDDVETFFDLLRAGRDNGSLLVPIGKGTAIRRIQRAN